MTWYGNNYTLIVVLSGVTIVGLTAGIMGVFTFLRKQSLLGDAISHAALPGIATMFLITHSTNPYVLLGGGAIAGIIGTLLMHHTVQKTSLKTDTMLGIVLSVFFGLGLVLLTMIQKLPLAQQSILNKFLFGNAATLLAYDVYMISMVACTVLTIVLMLWKEFKLITFDQNFARSNGIPVGYLNMLLTGLIIATILIGLQTVGVILMSSMLIAPAAAARQWATSLEKMVLFAGSFGIIASVCGTLISNTYHHLPTGPVIVIVASVIVFSSLVFARVS